MNENTNRAEARRLIGVAEKLLQTRDLNGTKDFAILAQETEPLLEGPDQILAVVDVLLSSEKRVNNHHDWYSILQLRRRTNDLDLIKKQYRRLALLLHPDKNKYPFADQAFKLVADAWAVLSDSGKKSLYDNELSLFASVDLSNAAKLAVRRSARPSAKKQGGDNAKSNANTSRCSGNNSSNRKDAKENFHYEDHMGQRAKLSSFWTACPYCYILHEYPMVYEDCCLRCQNCQRAFHAASIPSLPPLVPGKEAYYCCWGFFPLGFVFTGGGDGKSAGVGSGAGARFPNWMPPIFTPQQPASSKNDGVSVEAPVENKSGANVAASAPPPVQASAGRGDAARLMPRKRGRPRKYPVQA